ncbi:hypothetical protein [Lachnobacterium bovis]|uniref:hypothetical protein n=1 Tax=Lachnobacterium bovis TaxID=140626 RepID=UPI0004852438|nr:hypothetical protein [Lachnobacterium bovis]
MIKSKMKYIRSIHILIAFIIAVMLFMEASAINQRNNIGNVKNRIDYSYEDMPLSPEQVSNNLKSLKKTELPKYTFWGDSGYKSVKVEGIETTNNQKVIYFCGNSKNIVNSDVELYKDDNNCCILGKKTAFDLLGTFNAKGIKLQINGVEYIVSDVAKDVNEGIFAEVNEKSKEAKEQVLKYGTAYKPYAISVEEGTQADMISFSMEKERYMYERLYFYADSLIKMVVLLQMLLLILFICKYKKIQIIRLCKWLNHKGYNLIQKTPIREWDVFDKMPDFNGWYIKIVTVLIVIVCLITFRSIIIPRDFLPTQWSDFVFFKELAWQEIVTWKHFELISKLDNQYQIIEAFKLCMYDLKSVFIMMFVLVGTKIITR